MLDLVRTKIVDSMEYRLAPNVASGIAEGASLVATLSGVTDGQVTATPSTGGSNNDIFLGFAFNYFNPLDTAINVETFVAGAAGTSLTFNLQYAPVNASTAMFVSGSVTGALTYNGTLANGDYNVSGSTVLNYQTANAGETITVTYRYNLTAAQARFIQGDVYYGTTGASVTTGTIGVIRRGLVYTTMFDTAANWASLPTAIKAGANGYLQINGTGASLPVGSYVYQVPTADEPYLGVFVG